MDRLLAALRGAVGAAHVLTDADAVEGYATDWRGRRFGDPVAVVRPADTEEVVATLRACSAHDVPVVPQGGNTGLVGGGVPAGGEVLLSLRRLAEIGAVGPDGVVVGAGATLAAVNRAAMRSGVRVGVDLAARDSATIGGMVATNAGGIHVVAHGSMRQQVRGLEAVLADGTVLRRLPGLAKDNAGYDLPQLLAGSEGTLAVVTAVHLRLVPAPRGRTVVLVGCEDVDDALAVLAAARRAGALRAAELMRRPGLSLVAERTRATLPLAARTGTALLLELAHDPTPGADRAVGRPEPINPQIAAIAAKLVGGRPAVLAQDEADASRLWMLRERHTEVLSADGRPLAKLDVTVPLGALAAVVAAVEALDAGLAVLFGHLAEGTLHVNLLDAPDGTVEEVLGLVADHGGSIASEHGVGRDKARVLHLSRTPAEIAEMRAIKHALDPAALLNPGAVLP